MNYKNYQLLFGTEFEAVINWDKKYTNLGLGAFNQLYQLINLITETDQSFYENDVYIGPFCKDHSEGSIIPISYILNIDKMNKIYGYSFLDCLNYKNDCFIRYYIFNGVFTNYYTNRDKFDQSCKKIIFSNLLKGAVELTLLKKNLIGLKCNVAHIRFADPVAKNFLIKNDKLSDYNQLEEDCIKTIYQKCDKEIPLFVLVHDKSNEKVLSLKNDFNVIYIEPSEYEYNLPEILKNGRDLIAICDIIACYNLDVKNLIYQENENSISSFSIFLKNTLKYENCYKY